MFSISANGQIELKDSKIGIGTSEPDKEDMFKRGHTGYPTAGTNLINIKASGEVGIGAIIPESTLDV